MLNISSFGYISADSPSRHGCSIFRFIPGLLQVSPNSSHHVYFEFFFHVSADSQIPPLSGDMGITNRVRGPQSAAADPCQLWI